MKLQLCHKFNRNEEMDLRYGPALAEASGKDLPADSVSNWAV